MNQSLYVTKQPPAILQEVLLPNHVSLVSLWLQFMDRDTEVNITYSSYKWKQYHKYTTKKLPTYLTVHSN